jgi:hypothetical protein
LKYRKATLLATESATTAATKTIDLDLTEIISRIHLNIRATNSNNTLIAHPAKIIKKLEIVDGSDVLFSLSGLEAQALAEIGTGKQPVDVISYMTGDEIQPSMNIFFGRHLWDPKYAFDPKKFGNPQLKISHDKSLGGSTPTSMTLAVYADLFDEKAVSPEGFLMSKENYTYVPSASAHKYVDLPVDYPYRMLLMQTLSSGKQMGEVLSHIKISENMDKKVVMDQDTKDIIKLLLTETDPVIENILAYVAATATTIYCKSAYEGIAVGNQYGGAQYATSFGGVAGGTFTAYSTTAYYLKMLVRGWCPHGCYNIMPGHIDDPDDWYDPTALKSLRLDLTADSSPGSDAVNVITQQLRKY